MFKGVVIFLILVLSIPLAYSMTLKDLIAKYSFSAMTTQMNVTDFSDFMIDKDNNGINDTLIIELTTSNINGNFIFVVNLFDKEGILTNETLKTLSSGINKINVSFSSIFLTQPQFNYSVKIFNSTYSLKYRKDNILTQNYVNYEQGFKILNIKDSKLDKNLAINITLNSSINGTFETTLFLYYNNSIIFAKENKSLINSLQELAFTFYNETIKRTHHVGSFNVSSLKIGKKIMKTNFVTLHYDFRDFAVKSYIFGFGDNGADFNNNSKYDFLQINVSLQITEDSDYSILLALYDLFDNIIEINNISLPLNTGKNVVSLNINGSKIYKKKLNGPYVIKYIELYEDGILVDKINDAYITSYYSFNDYEIPSLPDLVINISVSDEYHYGIDNISINFSFENIGKKAAFNVFTEIFDNKTFFISNKSNILNISSKVLYQINFTDLSDFEISAIVDLQDFIEEINESNNAERITIKLNKKPSLNSIENISANETSRITINLSAFDPNNDNLIFSINLSKFSQNGSVFEWLTTLNDSGNYTIVATVSDGFLNDSVIFNVEVLDFYINDFDNDGIDDGIDTLIGDAGFVNTSTINLSMMIGNFSNLSKFFNQSYRVIFFDKNLSVAEFSFNFTAKKLNLTKITLDKQKTKLTNGSLFMKGLIMPKGTKKIMYVDRINKRLNSVCIKDLQITSIDEISPTCNKKNETKVTCNKKLYKSYRCSYNSTINKFKVEGLNHTGIVQIK